MSLGTEWSHVPLEQANPSESWQDTAGYSVPQSTLNPSFSHYTELCVFQHWTPHVPPGCPATLYLEILQ